MTNENLAKIEYFVADFIRTPYDLKMCANACGSPWTVGRETKTGIGLEQYNMYLKPNFFGERTRKEWIIISVLFNAKNGNMTTPSVWTMSAETAKKIITRDYPKGGFWKGNAEKNWRYSIPRDLLQEA